MTPLKPRAHYGIRVPGPCEPGFTHGPVPVPVMVIFRFLRTAPMHARISHDPDVRPSVCYPSVRLSNAWIVTRRRKLVLKFLYRMKDRSC